MARAKRAVPPAKVKRVTKPDLPRTEPIRSWSTLFGAASEGAPGSRATEESKIPGAPGAPAQGGGRGPSESVRRGVELGYRVLDDYIKQGSSMANAFSSPARGIGSVGDLPKMTERMFQYGSDFASMWFEAMGVMLSNANGNGAGAGAATEAEGASSRTSAASETKRSSSRLSLHVKSKKPTEVWLSLDEVVMGERTSRPAPGASEELTVEDLRAPGSRFAIGGATVVLPTDALGTVKVSLEIPPRTPAGRYTGAIVDRKTKNPRGRLTVAVGK